MIDLKTLHHYVSIGACYALTWCVLYGAQMYFFNQLAKTPDWLPARIGAGILAVLIIWRCFTITSPYR